MPEYVDVSIAGYEGQSLKSISSDRLAAVLAGKPSAKGWDFISRVTSRGTSTYHCSEDLGEGVRDYFIKFFDQAEVFRKAREKMFSAKGLVKPWRYPKQMLRHLFDPPFPRVGFEKALELQRHKINTAEVVAWLCRGRPVFKAGVLITRQISDVASANLGEYLISSRQRLPEDEFIREKRMLIRQLAEVMNRLIGLTFYLPDLRLKNLLVQKTGAGEPRLWIIDLVEAQDRKPAELKMLRHLITIPKYDAIFSGADKLRFLKWYLKPQGRESEWPQLCAQLTSLNDKWRRKRHKRNGNSAIESSG